MVQVYGAEMTSDNPKRRAAEAAVALVQDGMRLGIGTGSTAAEFIRLLADQVKAGLKVTGVPTSERSRALCAELDVPLATLAELPELDLAVDGADEFDGAMNLIKGGGGALLREKIVASCAARFVVIADASKRVDRLGAFPLPVEIVPFAARPLIARIEDLGATVMLRRAGAGPFVSDEGHHILDCAFGEIADPVGLAATLHDVPGVVDHGLFIGMADAVIVGADAGVEVIERR